jgi:hypothetical protein
MIKVDETIWQRSQEKAQPGSEIYFDGKGVKLVLFKIGYDKELSTIMNDVTKVRDYFRTNYAVNKIGLIECDVISICDHEAVKAVSKRSQPKMPNWYMGSVSIPLKKVSYVMTLYSEESDAERYRENLVLSEFKKQSEVDEKTDLPKDWCYDPYAKDYFGPSLYNVSDNVYYDDEYPEHPLSKLRFRMNQLIENLEIPVDDDFEGNSWWKIWRS